MSTVLTLLGTILIVAAAAVSLWVDGKHGKSGCGCSCESCASCGVCHHAAAKKKGELLRRLLAARSRKSV